VEVLIPDFGGDRSSLSAVIKARPDVLNHNIETVSRLYARVRPGAGYRRSLEIIKYAAGISFSLPTKSGLMLGLGETPAEVSEVLQDLRQAGCRLLTLGQYLQPTRAHLPVKRYVPPHEFQRWAAIARDMGFDEVASGPLVRSSYHARALFQGFHGKRSRRF